MKLISSKKTDEGKIELSIEVGADEFTPAVERAYKKNVSKINVPGFRRGKAPKAMVYKMYGEGMFFEDAINELYPEAYEQAVKEAELSPVAFPKIDIVKVDKDGFSFTALVVNKPEVEVGEYKGIKVEKIVKTVSEDEIDAQLEGMRQRGARIITVEDRAAQLGDTAVIDFLGMIDGVPFDGGSGENHSLKLGSGQFIPGFEEQIVGHKSGEEFDVNVKFPEDYHAELADKDAVFQIKLHELKAEELPELDDEFAKDVSEFDTLAELRSDIASKMQEHKNEESESDLENKIIDIIIDNMQGDIPEEMISAKVDEIGRDFEYRLQAQGITMLKYLEYMGQTKEGLRETFRPSAEKQVKIRLALEKVAELEKFEPTDEQVDAEYIRVAERFGGDVEKIKAAIPREEISEDTAVSMAIDLVKNSAVVTEATEAKTEEAEKSADKKEKAEKPAAKKPAAKKAAKKADEGQE